jgi:hypothetical protein
MVLSKTEGSWNVVVYARNPSTGGGAPGSQPASVTLHGSDDSDLRKKEQTLADGSRGRRAHHASEGGEQAASLVLGAGSRESTALTTERKQREWDQAINLGRGGRGGWGRERVSNT